MTSDSQHPPLPGPRASTQALIAKTSPEDLQWAGGPTCTFSRLTRILWGCTLFPFYKANGDSQELSNTPTDEEMDSSGPLDGKPGLTFPPATPHCRQADGPGLAPHSMTEETGRQQTSL